MKRLALLFALPAFLLGCPGPTPGPTDAGQNDAGETTDLESLVLKVTGTAEIHPAAVTWAVDAGVALPSLVGATARVEEPLRLALNENDQNAIFSSTVLDSSLSYTAEEVPNERVIVGLAVGFVDSADAGLYRAASTIYDVTREDGKSATNINGKVAYALPQAFVDQLTTAIGSTNVSTASDNAGNTVGAAGFAIIRIVDAAGAPVLGAKLTYSCKTCAKALNGNQFWYLNDQLNAATSADANGTTGAQGLVVYINKESLAHQIFIKVAGNDTYPEHSAGAKAGRGLTVTVSPK